MKKKIEEEIEVIRILADIGVPKEVTLEILHELMFNSDKYAGNQDEIDTLLLDKLGIDLYLNLENYIKL